MAQTYNASISYDISNISFEGPDYKGSSATGSGQSTQTSAAIKFDFRYKYQDTLTYDSLSSSYDGIKGFVATGSGSGEQTAVGSGFAPVDQYDEQGVTYDSSVLSYALNPSYDQSTITYDKSGANYFGVVVRTGSVSGSSSQTTVSFKIAPRTASETSTGVSIAIGIGSKPPTPRDAYGSGVGGSTVSASKATLRTSTSIGIGTSSATPAKVIFRQSSSSAFGSMDIATWMNGGEYLDRIIRMRPIYGPGFRKKVNYSTKR